MKLAALLTLEAVDSADLDELLPPLGRVLVELLFERPDLGFVGRDDSDALVHREIRVVGEEATEEVTSEAGLPGVAERPLGLVFSATRYVVDQVWREAGLCVVRHGDWGGIGATRRGLSTQVRGVPELPTVEASGGELPDLRVHAVLHREHMHLPTQNVYT
jgi:hypothetical protein